MSSCAFVGPGSLSEVGRQPHTGRGLAASSFLLTRRGSPGPPPIFSSAMEEAA
jgi:hypothetical protein